MAKHNQDDPYLKLLWDDQEEQDDDHDDDDEALSFSDLPVQLQHIDQPPRQYSKDGSVSDSDSNSESEFEFRLGFGSWLGSLSTQPLPEMCVADDLFFQGRILPLRRRHHSPPLSSEKNSLDETNRSTPVPVSRSDSMDRGSISRVTSTSSRSSSKGSQHSSIYSMTSTSTSTSFASSRVTYSSVSNRFGSCPSPSPQTGFPGNNKPVLLPGTKIQRNLYSSSSKWEFFRAGLVRTPDIELQNIKTRPNNNNNNNNICDNDNREKQGSKKKKKGIGFGLLGGCKCTADSVATNLVLLRSDSRRIWGRRKSNVGSVEEEELRRKLMELIEIDDNRAMKAKKKEKVEEHRGDGRSLRHRRTFEWVKELPHAGGYFVLNQY